MNFQTSVRTCLKEKYCTFQGRASRSEFWFFMLFEALFAEAMNMLYASELLDVLVTMLPFISSEIFAITTLLSYALTIPSLAVTARRLHDTNRSGWCQLWFIIPPYFFLWIRDSDPEALGLFAFIALIPVITLLVFVIKKGTEGENRFGPPPITKIEKKKILPKKPTRKHARSRIRHLRP